MTPERAASLFRELLQTPIGELPNFSRRHGLPGHPGPHDLEHGRELLQALMIALQSGPGPNWDRIADAWNTMRTNHGPIDLSAMGVAPPAWVRDVPPKPTLGDPAPGTTAQAAQAEQRQKFVPVAKPQQVPQAPGAAPVPAHAPAAHPQAAAPAAPMPAAAHPPAPAGPPPPAAPSAPAVASGYAPPQPAAPLPSAPAAAHGPYGPAPSPSAPGVAPAPLPPSEHVRSATYPPAPVAPGPGVPARQLVAPAWDTPADDQPGARTPMGEAYAPSNPPGGAPATGPAQHVSPLPSAAQAPAPAPLPPVQPAAPYAAAAPAQPAVPYAPPAPGQPPPPPRRGAPPPPAQGSAPVAGPSLEMSVSTYAAFCAACAAMPGRVAETQREYGIANDEQRASLDDLWQDRFDEDPALHQQWEQMFARFRDQLRSRQG